MRLLISWLHILTQNQGWLCKNKIEQSEKCFHLVELIKGLFELCIEQLIKAAGHLVLNPQLVGPILTGEYKHWLASKHVRLSFAKKQQQQQQSPTGPPPPRDLSVSARPKARPAVPSRPTLSPPDYVTQVKRTPCHFHCLNCSFFNMESVREGRK